MFKKIFISIFLTSSFCYSKEHIIHQSGKTFLHGLDDNMAKAISNDREKLKQSQVKDIKIKINDSLIFKNVDSVRHNAFVDDVFNFLQDPNKEDRHLFKKKGTYNVQCAIHPKMKLQVIVE